MAGALLAKVKAAAGNGKACAVAWVGDYLEPEALPRGLREPVYTCEHGTPDERPLRLQGIVLVNLAKNEFLDGSHFLSKQAFLDRDGYHAMHPLALLTAIGNGLGGGDYDGTDMDLVGRWALDPLTVMDAADFAHWYADQKIKGAPPKAVMPVFIRY